MKCFSTKVSQRNLSSHCGFQSTFASTEPEVFSLDTRTLHLSEYPNTALLVVKRLNASGKERSTQLSFDRLFSNTILFEEKTKAFTIITRHSSDLSTFTAMHNSAASTFTGMSYPEKFVSG
jgi:hypothetical protein